MSFQDGGLPGPANSESGGPDFVMMAMAWMVLAVVLYLMRPTSLRGPADPTTEKNNGKQQ